MEGINKIFCGADVKNTGVCECFFDPKLIVGAIFVPRNRVFTNAELADAAILNTFKVATLAPRATRVYPFQGFVAITDSTEDPTQQTFGYGGIRQVREGNYNWLFQFTEGGVNLSNALRSFNGLTGKYAPIFILSDNTLLGTSKLDANGDHGLAGVPQQDIYTRPWKAADGSNVAVFATQFTFRPEYINENIAFKKVSTTSYMLSELVGLEDIVLELVSVDDAIAVVRADSDCGSTDIYDLYADELAQATAWIIKNAAGTTKPHTAAKNVSAKGWTLTITGGGDFAEGDTITLAAPAVLAVDPINVVGYEGSTITVDLGS